MLFRSVVDILARDNASRTFARVGDSAQRSTRGLLGASRAMEVTRAASMALATGLGVAAFGIMKVGSDYVDSLNKIQALTGAGNATMKRAAETLEGNASVYAKMGQTTGDAAKGVVELTKAGLSLDKSLKSATATMILAKAGEMETGEAATFVSNTLNTFSLKAKDAGRVVDILANAANKSSADVSDLAETMKYVGPIAAQSGVSVQELGGLMAELDFRNEVRNIALFRDMYRDREDVVIPRPYSKLSSDLRSRRLVQLHFPFLLACNCFLRN